jgi:dTMP kinase
MEKGKFITLEGGEGTGKSTQARHLGEFLKKNNIPFILTREPGGSPGAELIRTLLVSGKPDRWDLFSEYLLFSAARRDHIIHLILPALERGEWVICDRFFDSSRAYQGIARGLDSNFMEFIYQHISEHLIPDLTVVFDLPVDESQKRISHRAKNEDRFEQMGNAFHERIRDAFIKITQKEPGRCAVIDATKTEAEITERLAHLLKEKFPSSFL